MFELLKARLRHGYQATPNPLETGIHPAFPGLPSLLRNSYEDFIAAAAICPTQSIGTQSLDLGKCVFCGLCQRRFPETFRFEPDFRVASNTREGLVIRWSDELQSSTKPIVETDTRLRKLFRRSFALRNVSAGGCNACELELGACSNVNFDMGRYGVEVVASPRHADALIVTGPVSQNMEYALRETWEAIPEPKVLILSGACAISGGSFADAGVLDRKWLDEQSVAIYIPGCPAHPLSIIHALRSLLGAVK